MVEPGWLLRCARRYGSDPELATAAVFARGRSGVEAVHRSQVTRWENGELAPTYSVVRRYERVCGLPDGQLTTALDFLHRDEEPVGARPRLRRLLPGEPAGETDRLLTTALDGRPMAGEDWDRLSALLGELPAAFLRSADWGALVRQVLREMAVTVGLPYLQRAEAAARIAGHPRAAGAVLGVVAENLADPAAQVYSESAALLQNCPHPEVPAVLLEVVRDPVNVHALRAGLFAASTLVRAGRFPPRDAVTLVELALEHCRDQQRPYRVRRSAADVLLVLTPAARRRIAGALHRHPGDLGVASIVRGEGPRPVAQLRALRRRVQGRLGELAGEGVLDEAPLLRLLDFLTLETNDERHGHALALLMLLPFGPAVGRAYLAELESSLERGDALGVHESLGILRCLTPNDEVDLLTDLAVRARPVEGPRLDEADAVAVEACWALGNAKFVAAPTPGVEDRLAGAVREVLAGERAASPRLQEAWAYALWMRGRRDLLERLAPTRAAASNGPGSAAVPAGDAPAWTRARDWWLAVPPYLSAPTARAGTPPPAPAWG